MGETDATRGPRGAARLGCGRVSYCTEKEDLSLGRWPGQSLVPTHGQVHKGEHVELRHDGEAEEHAVQEEAPTPQLLVQLPFVQVNSKYL